MPFRSRVNLPARRAGTRRKTLWGGTTGATAVTTLAGGTALLFSSFTAAQLAVIGVPLTIIRNRGLFSVKPNQFVASEEPFGAFGMAIVSEQAAAAGIASVPTPFADSAWDGWMVWQPFATAITFGTGVGFDEAAFTHFPYDSKAMRKVEDNERLIFVVENASAAGELKFLWISRTLFKLH